MTTFGVKRNGEPLHLLQLKRQLQTGIEYQQTVPGIVPEIEERESARFAGYTWREWLELPRDERADSIAWHRINQLISAHVAEAQADYSERQIAAQRARTNQGL